MVTSVVIYMSHAIQNQSYINVIDVGVSAFSESVMFSLIYFPLVVMLLAKQLLFVCMYM